jgi:hypothetical protein
MSAANYACYDQMVGGTWSRAHVLAAMPTASHVPAGIKRSFIKDATAHRRVPEVLLT